MNRKHLLFVSFFLALAGVLILTSLIPTTTLSPSQAKERQGYVCVFGELDLDCKEGNSFGTICENECIRLVVFNQCTTKLSNATVCGKLTYYQNELELVVTGKI